MVKYIIGFNRLKYKENEMTDLIKGEFKKINITNHIKNIVIANIYNIWSFACLNIYYKSI